MYTVNHCSLSLVRMVTDGKIQMAVVVAYYKKFYPERYIVLLLIINEYNLPPLFLVLPGPGYKV